MSDNQQQMRQKLDETKAHLFAKLQVLEDQISETIETTGTKVKSTVGVVASAVHSVSNALDVKRQFERNPWWWLGGALALGYVAGGRGHRKDQDLKRRAIAGSSGIASLDSFVTEDAGTSPEATASLAAVSAAYELGSRQSTANQARTLALNATIRIVEEVISRTVPIMINHFSRKPDAP